MRVTPRVPRISDTSATANRTLPTQLCSAVQDDAAQTIHTEAEVRAVTKFKAGDLAGVGYLVDSDAICPSCKAGLEQFCPNQVLTYGFPDKIWAV